jgi:hypothetical protein
VVVRRKRSEATRGMLHLMLHHVPFVPKELAIVMRSHSIKPLVIFAALTVVVLLIAGCSSSTPTATPPSMPWSETSTKKTATPVQDATAAATESSPLPPSVNIEATGQGMAASVTEEDIPPIPLLPFDGSLYMGYFTADQVEEVRSCFASDRDDWQLPARYPHDLTIEDLPGVYIPTTPCDWALLADAYAFRALVLDEDEYAVAEVLTVPTYGRYSYAQAVIANPAYALATSALFAAYFDRVDLMEPLAIHGQIAAVQIDTGYSQMGYWIDRTTMIIQANTSPIAYDVMAEYDYAPGADDRTVPTTTHTLTAYPEIASIQRLSTSLTHLLPVRESFEATFGGPICGEYGSHWEITIWYDNDIIIRAHDASHLFVTGGGPTVIDLNTRSIAGTPFGTFVQQSSDFLLAMTDLVAEIDPAFEIAPDFQQSPGQLTCGAQWFDLFDLAFPPDD